MVVSEAREHGRLLALRLALMLTLVLVFGLLPQFVALATVFGYARPVYALAALVVVNGAAQIVTGLRHQRRTGGGRPIAWAIRSAVQELVLVGGLIAIGVGHSEAGWWAALVYLVATVAETAMRYRRAGHGPRRASRRTLDRKWTDAEARVQQAETAIELAESVMVGVPDDEDAQSAAQQLRHAGVQARQLALEGLWDVHATEVQIRDASRARLQAALRDLEESSFLRSRRAGHGDKLPHEPADTGIDDRWTS